MTFEAFGTTGAALLRILACPWSARRAALFFSIGLTCSSVVQPAAAKSAPKQADQVAAPPAAEVDLRIEPTATSGIWKMTVENRSPEVLRVAADARLLTLEIRPPSNDVALPAGRKAKKPKFSTCRLPSGMRPTEVDDDRALLLARGQSYEELFEPALYCFGADSAAAFARGGSVVARLGFASPTKVRSRKRAAAAGPFVAEPVRPAATVSGVTELVAPAIALRPAQAPGNPMSPSGGRATEDGAGASEAPGSTAPADPSAPRLTLSATRYIDAIDADAIDMKVSAKNVGRRTLRAFLRRDGLVFDVAGPTGTASCGDLQPLRNNPPDALTVLKPSQHATLDVLLGELCPDGTFDRPGLYRVRVRLSAFAGEAPSNGAKAVWSGTVSTGEKTPSLIRVRKGTRSFHEGPPQARPSFSSGS